MFDLKQAESEWKRGERLYDWVARREEGEKTLSADGLSREEHEKGRLFGNASRQRHCWSSAEKAVRNAVVSCSGKGA